MLQIPRHDSVRSPLHRLPIDQIVIPHHHVHRSRQPIPLILPHRINIFLALKELLRVLDAFHLDLAAAVKVQQLESLKRRRFLLVFGVEVVLPSVVGQQAMLVVERGTERGLLTWTYLVLYAAKALDPTARSAWTVCQCLWKAS